MRKLDTNQSRDARLDETYYMLLPYLNTHTHPHNPMLQVYRTEDNCSADLHTLQQKKIVQLHRRSIQPTNQTPRALSLGGLRCLSIKLFAVLHPRYSSWRKYSLQQPREPLKIHKPKYSALGWIVPDQTTNADNDDNDCVFCVCVFRAGRIWCGVIFAFYTAQGTSGNNVLVCLAMRRAKESVKDQGVRIRGNLVDRHFPRYFAVPSQVKYCV